MNRIRQRFFTPGALCLLLCVLYLIAGLWPFDFFPTNHVDWMSEPPGLRFRGGNRGAEHGASGLAFTPRPLEAPAGSRSVSIEVRLRCNREPKGTVPGILVFCDANKKPFLFLGQWKSALIVRRFNTGGRGARPWKEASVLNALTAGAIRSVTLTSKGSECILYVDGFPIKRYPRFSLLPDPGSLEGCYLVLGNTPEASGGWTGDILGVALYDRSLSEEEVMQDFRSWVLGEGGPARRKDGLFLRYEFRKESEGKVLDRSGMGNDLLIPEHPRFATRLFSPVEVSLLRRRSFIQDVIINILGFIPFGLCFCISLARRTRLRVPLVIAAGTLGGFVISLVIELAQSQIPVRTSSAADLISNTLGAGLGALLFALLLSRHKNPICRE